MIFIKTKTVGISVDLCLPEAQARKLVKKLQLELE